MNRDYNFLDPQREATMEKYVGIGIMLKASGEMIEIPSSLSDASHELEQRFLSSSN